LTGSALVRNGLFSLILLLLVATVHEANLPVTQALEEYLAFVLTTDFDYRPWLAGIAARLELPDLPAFPVFGGSPGAPADPTPLSDDPQR